MQCKTISKKKNFDLPKKTPFRVFLEFFSDKKAFFPHFIPIFEEKKISIFFFISPKCAYRAKNLNCQKRPFLGKISKNGFSKVNLYHHLLSNFEEKKF